MTLEIKNGYIAQARKLASPNFDDRPDEDDISLIIIHGISLPPGEYGGPGIDQLFTNRLDPGEHPYYRDIYELRVSSHLLIRRNGELVQYVSLDKRAWHAGESNFRGRSQCNDFSIGIELEGDDDAPYEDIQYAVLNEVVALLRNTYSDIGSDCIVGHCDVAPGRKTDPGSGFQWDRLHDEIA